MPMSTTAGREKEFYNKEKPENYNNKLMFDLRSIDRRVFPPDVQGFYALCTYCSTQMKADDSEIIK